MQRNKEELVLQIKSTIDALIFVGSSIIDSDHVEAILHGLTKEYGPFITTVISRTDLIFVGELEALLMA